MEGYEYAPSKPGKAPEPRVDSTPPERLGIVPRAVKLLFSKVAACNAAAKASGGTQETRVLCSFVQVYREQVLDLLNPAAPELHGQLRGLKVRWSVAREFYAENLFVEEAADAGHALSLFETGVRHKRMAETRMNAASSRSHCLFALTVQRVDTSSGQVESEGRLTLVDLAGSERQQVLLDHAGLGPSKAEMADSVEINKSLFTLRKVILTLSEADQTKAAGHVPYRDSTLTKLLKQSLGGACHTLMIACLSPADAHVEENISTLTYAARARTITNAPKQMMEPRAAKISALQEEVRRRQTPARPPARVAPTRARGVAGGGTQGGDPPAQQAARDGRPHRRRRHARRDCRHAVRAAGQRSVATGGLRGRVLLACAAHRRQQHRCGRGGAAAGVAAAAGAAGEAPRGGRHRERRGEQGARPRARARAD